MKPVYLGMIAIFVIFGIVLINTNLAFATNSKNVYGLSVGGREFVVSYDISNATVNGILVKKNLSYTNHYSYSLMIIIDNDTTSSGTLTVTMPSELMASTCQSGFYPKVSINNGTFHDADEISNTKTNDTILIKFPPFTKNIGIIGYGPDPSSGCPTFAYNMTYNGKTYWIDYKSNPEIQDFSMDKNGSSLVVTLSHLYHFPPPIPWSYADIQIPRNLLDSKMGQSDVPFTVMVDGNMTQIQEIETTNTTRTIHIPLRGGLYYQDNDGEIVITGTTTLSPPIHETNPTDLQSPLQQFKSGIKAEDVKCVDGFTLVIKSEDGSPACVTPDTANILIERGWATNMAQTNQVTSVKANPFGITALVIYHPPSRCLTPPSNTTLPSCPPNNFYLKINSNSTAYLMSYNICDGNSCAKNNDSSILLPINTILNPHYQTIGLPVNLQWKYGDTVNIQLEVSPNADNNMASLIDLGNSTIIS